MTAAGPGHLLEEFFCLLLVTVGVAVLKNVPVNDDVDIVAERRFHNEFDRLFHPGIPDVARTITIRVHGSPDHGDMPVIDEMAHGIACEGVQFQVV